MSRLPDELVERMKREISVQRLAEARGVKLRRSGKELIGLCPFHDDHSPSLTVDPVENVWHCKGACSTGGSVIDWVMRAEGISVRHAMELLRRDYLPSAAATTGPPPKQCTVPKLPPLFQGNIDDQSALKVVVDYYHETLKNSPEAQQYLMKRGLESSEMMAHFRLGFSNRSLNYYLPDKNRAAGAEQRGRLAKLGVLRESGHEHFNGSVVIPIFNRNGDVVQMYGRKITARLRPGTPDHLYLPGPHRGVWNEEALIASKEIILCESLIDALTFWCAGFRQVTTSYGVNGFTDEHRAAFKKYGTNKIYIAYDRDQAGEKAAARLAEELMEMGIECLRVRFPKDMDANDYARTTRPAAKALGMMLNSAAWLGKGKRPAVAVIEPVEIECEEPPQIEAEETAPPMEPEQPAEESVTEQKAEPAAKEENAISLPDTSMVENVLSLAADSEMPAVVSSPPLPSVLATSVDVPCEIKGDEVIIWQGDRRYRVRGLQKNMSYELLKINLMVSGKNLRGESGFHVDTLDLYSARQRTVFIKQAAEELKLKEETIQREVGHVLIKLEELQGRQIEAALVQEKTEVEIGAEEKAAAMELLRDPHLLERVLGDFVRCGVVGEETNKKIGYLAAVSRLLDRPLAVVVQSSSAAGKSSLMEAVLDFLPEEQRIEYSAMTGQALFYMGEKDLKHKVLAIVEEEGAQRAAYALKLLQSEGALTIASTGKDPNNGRLITHNYRVEGPVMIFLTTTAIDVDEELLNRCIVLTVNEDREQTQAIHRMQRESETREGLWAREDRSEILKLHRNAQRLLKPMRVVNEHARELTFPDSQTRTRRDHTKFLTLMRAVALLHQYQREIKTDTRNGKTIEYIEVTEADVALARELVNQVLVRSLDELPPQTKRLLFLIDEMVRNACQEQQLERSDYRFSRRTVRHYTSWGDSALKKHLGRLEELEYLIVHRGGRGQSFVYELYFEVDDEGQPVVPGLGYNYDENKSRSKGQLSPGGHGQVSGMARGGHGEESPMMARQNGDFSRNRSENTIPDERDENRIVAMRKSVVGVK